MSQAPDTISWLEGKIETLESELDAIRVELDKWPPLMAEQVKLTEALKRKLDEAAKQAIWQPLTGVGQIREGMKVRFMLSGKPVSATAKLILRSGTNREEVVYKSAKNHYFITSMAIDGTSAHKSVEFLASANLPALIEQARVEERERIFTEQKARISAAEAIAHSAIRARGEKK